MAEVYFARGRRVAGPYNGHGPRGRCDVLDVLDLNAAGPGARSFSDWEDFYAFTIDPGQDLIARTVVDKYAAMPLSNKPLLNSGR